MSRIDTSTATNRQLRKRPGSPYWYITWTEGRRSHRKSTGTNDENEAKRILARELAAHTRPDEGEERVDRCLSFYLDYKKEEYYSNTEDPSHHKQFLSLENGLVPIFRAFGDLLVRDITPTLVRQFISTERKSGIKNKDGTTRGKSDGAIRKHLALLRAALNRCKKEGFYTGDIPDFDLPPIGRPRERIMTEEEFKKFMKADALEHIQLFCMIMAHTLKRPGAILQLQWGWGVDLEKRLINFQRPDQRETKKKRTPSPINKSLLKALLEAKERATTDYVIEFRGRSVKKINKGFNAKAKKAKLPWVVPYTLRHTGASLLAMKGVPLADISEMLGSDEATVRQHYRKFQPDYLRESSNVLEKILS